LRYLFEEYVFDTKRRELHRGAAAISVTPQVFDLLYYLIQNRQHVVSKSDLINAIWNGRIVSDSALTTRLNAARIAIGDSGDEQRLIKTLPRKGFRFVGAIREAQERAGETVVDNQDKLQKPDVALPGKPSIAVLPFENMSGEPEQEYFTDGMVEEIITALSRFKSLFVIARHSSFTFKGRAVDIKEVGRGLGVRYILEGSVRKASGKVRITGQLVDAVTGAHLWADRFEGDLTDVFALQDEVTVAVVSAIEPKMLQTEIAMATRRPENLTAYDFYLRALPHYYLMTREGLAEAINLAHRALELDPRFGAVATLEGLCHMQNVVLGYADDIQFDRKEAVRLVRLALSIDDSDPETLATASVISAFLVGDSEAEIEMADRAVALNPNSWSTWNSRGWVYNYAGLPDEAIRSFERAIRMSPLDPRLYTTLIGIGQALIELRRFDEAIVVLKKALRQNSSNSGIYRCLASAFAHLGRVAEAHTAAAHVLEIDPAFTIPTLIARVPKNSRLYIEGLRKAGLPE
jgi:TolB-like protein/tetratricopeptide (TPR) repeat protein